MSSTNHVSRCGGGAPVAAPGDRLRWLRQVACSEELSPGFRDEELCAWRGLGEGVLRQMGLSDAVQLDSMQSQASTVCSFSSSTLSPALSSACTPAAGRVSDLSTEVQTPARDNHRGQGCRFTRQHIGQSLLVSLSGRLLKSRTIARRGPRRFCCACSSAVAGRRPAALNDLLYSNILYCQKLLLGCKKITKSNKLKCGFLFTRSGALLF